jgi:hypothetical protein
VKVISPTLTPLTTDWLLALRCEGPAPESVGLVRGAEGWRWNHLHGAGRATYPGTTFTHMAWSVRRGRFPWDMGHSMSDDLQPLKGMWNEASD